MVRRLGRREGRSPDRRTNRRRRRERLDGLAFQSGRERGGCLPTDPAVRPTVVVLQTPLIQHVSRLGQAEEQFPVQQLVSQSAVSGVIENLGTLLNGTRITISVSLCRGEW